MTFVKTLCYDVLLWRFVMTFCDDVLLWRFVMTFCYDVLLWRFVVTFCYNVLLWRYVMTFYYVDDEEMVQPITLSNRAERIFLIIFCFYFLLWLFIVWLSLKQLENYNFGKWSQMMNKANYFIFYEKNSVYCTWIVEIVKNPETLSNMFFDD